MRSLVLFVAAFAVIAVSTLIASIDSAADATMAKSVVVVSIIVLVMVAGLVWGRDPRLPWICDPLLLTCAFLAQFYIVGPFAIRVVEIFSVPFAFKYSDDKQVTALLAFLLFVVALIAGHRLRLGVILGAALPDFRGSRRRLPARWIELFLVLGGMVGMFGWILFQGGLSTRLNTAYGSGRGGGAMFRIAFVAIQSGTLLLAWRVFDAKVLGPARRQWFIFLLIFQVLAFGVVIGMRKYLLFLFFGIVSVWVLRRGWAAIPKAKIAATFAVLMLFFSIWGQVRNQPLGEIIEGSANHLYADSGPFYYGYLNAVGGPYEVACLVYELYPDKEPFRHGGTLLVSVLGFIPRAIWPEKPIGIGKEITQYIVGPFYDPLYGFSVTVTLPADLYINFGWLGIGLGGLLFGILCRTVGSYATHRMTAGVQTRAARVLLPAVFVMGLGEVRADMSMLFMVYLLSMVPVLFALTFFRFDSVTDEVPRVVG